MAFTPQHRTTTTVRHDFFVPDGSTAKDLGDAVRYIQGQIEVVKGPKGNEYDDAFYVRAGDEGIYIYFDVDPERGKV